MPTTDDKPLACTLDLDALAPRLAAIRALTAEKLLSHELAGRVLRPRYLPEAAAQLARIVELERVCCAFLEFDMHATAADVRVAITAPAEAGEAAAWLFAQFLPEGPAPSASASCGCSGGAECR